MSLDTHTHKAVEVHFDDDYYYYHFFHYFLFFPMFSYVYPSVFRDLSSDNIQWSKLSLYFPTKT